jgi:hypothetical protein
VFDKAAKTPVEAYTETLSGAALLDAEPAPGKIVSGKTLPAIGTTEWTLSNGIRVYVKPTDFKDDEIVFNASSPGGTSLAPDPDFMSAAFCVADRGTERNREVHRDRSKQEARGKGGARERSGRRDE